jgi:hypothetical protein
MLELLLMALAAHFVGDFVFQNHWMAIEKGKSWEINLYHALVYISTFILFRVIISPLSLFIIASTHFVIDSLKARYGYIKHIWQDQLLHILVILLVLFLLK